MSQVSRMACREDAVLRLDVAVHDACRGAIAGSRRLRCDGTRHTTALAHNPHISVLLLTHCVAPLQALQQLLHGHAQDRRLALRAL